MRCAVEAARHEAGSHNHHQLTAIEFAKAVKQKTNGKIDAAPRVSRVSGVRIIPSAVDCGVAGVGVLYVWLLRRRKKLAVGREPVGLVVRPGRLTVRRRRRSCRLLRRGHHA